MHGSIYRDTVCCSCDSDTSLHYFFFFFHITTSFKKYRMISVFVVVVFSIRKSLCFLVTLGYCERSHYFKGIKSFP